MEQQPWRTLDVLDQLQLGVAMFGDYAVWLWAVPVVWAATAIALWTSQLRFERRQLRAYLRYFGRRLPYFGLLARARADELARRDHPARRMGRSPTPRPRRLE